MAVAVAQRLAVDDGSEGDSSEELTALLDAMAGASTPVLRADCWRAKPNPAADPKSSALAAPFRLRPNPAVASTNTRTTKQANHQVCALG